MKLSMTGCAPSALNLARNIVVIFCVITPLSAIARDFGQWGNVPSATREWFSSLTQPNRPEAYCCGDTDVYYADEYAVDRETGGVIATVTDNRGNHIPIGTRVHVPAHLINRDPNITSHVLLFLGGTTAKPVVFCFLPASGV